MRNPYRCRVDGIHRPLAGSKADEKVELRQLRGVKVTTQVAECVGCGRRIVQMIGPVWGTTKGLIA